MLLDSEGVPSGTSHMPSWQDASQVDARPLAELGLNPIVSRTLVRRGMSDPIAARTFLDPDLAIPSSPMELPGMDRALERIKTALDHHEAIFIWGDFDVDGQTATSLLVQALRSIGASPKFHVPVRSREGHGVHLDTLASFIDAGAQLIITCDTGISADEAVNYARSRGVDVVITDHHELGHTLPDAVAVVNPRLLPPEHPLGNLAGVGVAFELASALLESRALPSDDLLDLVALGLIADVALLQGDTRLLAQRGIKALRSTPRLGLQALAKLAKINPKTLNEVTIGFELAPRLNAVGRLGDANEAVELLLTNDPERASRLAAQVEDLNIRRRLLTEQVSGAAEEQLRADPALLEQPILILSNPSWPGGVLGIVASRLVDRYQKPALLLSAGQDGSWHGSARSIEGLDITAAIAANEKHLLAFGGHPMAAGLSFRGDLLPRLKQDLERSVGQMLLEAQVPEATLSIDEWVGLSQLSLELADQLSPLSPFGAGNPELIFGAHNVRLVSANAFGKTEKHRRIVVTDEHGVEREMVWWNSVHQAISAEVLDVACSIRADTFRGERRLSLEVKDLRPAGTAIIQVASPQVEIVDLRLKARPEDDLPGDCLIWAEAAEVARGQDRRHLRHAREFAIWTSPASGDDLRAAMATVRPRKVYLICRAPPAPGFRAFIERLAGLAKYAINHRGGRLLAADIAAVTANRELTVRLGLEWLAASGQLTIQEDDDGLQLALAAAAPNRDLQAELRAGVQSLLEETAAYRHHINRAAPNALSELSW